jgi:hypothetical protein
MSDEPNTTVRLTVRGHWTIARMRALDPEAFTDAALRRRDMDRRRGLAMVKVLEQWDAENA